MQNGLDELQLKQLIKSTVEEVVSEKQTEQSSLIAKSVVEFLKESNSVNDEEHKIQHEWIKQQIEKEKKIQDRYSDLKWKSVGSMLFFGFVGVISASGWALVKFLEDIFKNGGM